jgi:hypothetical protein
MDQIKVAVLGAGGLGRAACRIIGMKRQLRLVAICDSKGLVVDPSGVNCEAITSGSGDLVNSYAEIPRAERSPRVSLSELTRPTASVADTAVATQTFLSKHTDDPLGELLEAADGIDAMLITLPNMPNEFIPGVVRRFVEVRRDLVMVDVLKRTTAVEQMCALDGTVKASRSVVMTGCGATPGLLTAAAVLAAQSFIEIERVDIWWGVGIANWDAYKSTIREDIAHVPGYSVARAKAMTDADVEAFLDKTAGLMELHHMEHADDVLLQRAGVVQSREQVEVGGVMDTRHAKKPVSTTMTLTGITFDGKRATHRFILGDETTMAANVIGPALGYLKRGVWLRDHGLFGVFGSADMLPMVIR